MAHTYTHTHTHIRHGKVDPAHQLSHRAGTTSGRRSPLPFSLESVRLSHHDVTQRRRRPCPLLAPQNPIIDPTWRGAGSRFPHGGHHPTGQWSVAIWRQCRLLGHTISPKNRESKEPRRKNGRVKQTFNSSQPSIEKRRHGCEWIRTRVCVCFLSLFLSVKTLHHTAKQDYCQSLRSNRAQHT